MTIRSRLTRRLRTTSGFEELKPEVAKNTHDLNDVSDHITALYHHHLDINHRVHELETSHARLVETVEALADRMPAVLNAIASSFGTSRLLRQEVVEFEHRMRSEVDEMRAIDRVEVDSLRLETRETTDRLLGHVRDELWPLIPRVDSIEPMNSAIEFLLRRVETVRAEMLHELRYGADPTASAVASEVVNEELWKAALESGLRLNLGCGHLPVEGFVNVDMRKLPAVDLVAAVDDLPVGPESVDEIFSAHMLEHFPESQLSRQLLPYWFSILRPGGVFRAVVPDQDAMVARYGNGEISFITLREVTYGGQEYSGDFHYNAFTPESLEAMLRAAGFVDVETLARARPNGDCLEFEMSAIRPL
jgi:SAM-dependent methyltransferase